MTALVRHIGHFLIGMTFLTCLPMPGMQAHHPASLARAAVFFPLIGGLIGAIVGLIFMLTSLVMPAPIAAALALISGLVLTGALHEDGLADSADAMGGRDIPHRLEIMRDSRLGTYGGLALICSVGLRWAMLMSLDSDLALAALIVAHGVSRGLLPAILVSPRRARADGLGSSVAGAVTMPEAVLSAAISLTLAMIAGVTAGLMAFALAVIMGALSLALILRRFGGYTGDSLGAIQQVLEIAVLLVLTALWT